MSYTSFPMKGMSASIENLPKLSVILPVYNAEATLERTLESIKASSETSLEIICVNDGSKDASGDILRKITQNDARFVVIEQENQGVSAARNAALQECTGKYVIFVDADDEVRPDYFANLLQEADSHAADLVVCGFSVCLENGTVQESRYAARVYDTLTPDVLTSLPVGVCSHLYRRHILATENGILTFPVGVRYGEDTAFHYAVFPKITKLVISAECGYIIHETEGSATDRGSQLISDMPTVLEWLNSLYKIHNMKGMEYLVLYAKHTMQRMYSLASCAVIKTNLRALQNAMLKCDIRGEDMDCLPKKYQKRLKSILLGCCRPPFSFYIKRLKNIRKLFA